MDEIVKTQRFVPAKGFQGAEAQPGQAPRQAPVEFEVCYYYIINPNSKKNN